MTFIFTPVDADMLVGSHQDLALPIQIPIRDPNCVAIPLEPSNAIEIEIVE